MNNLHAQLHNSDDFYRQIERSADAAESNASATAQLVEETKRANEAREQLELLKLQREARKEAEEKLARFVHEVSSTGDGVSVDDPTASKLGWY